MDHTVHLTPCQGTGGLSCVLIYRLAGKVIISLLWIGTHVGPTAAGERAFPNSLHVSLEEWPRLPYTARSASKKGTWALLPILPSSLIIPKGVGLSCCSLLVA